MLAVSAVAVQVALMVFLDRQRTAQLTRVAAAVARLRLVVLAVQAL
jgi:hypothetical protein